MISIFDDAKQFRSCGGCNVAETLLQNWNPLLQLMQHTPGLAPGIASIVERLLHFERDEGSAGRHTLIIENKLQSVASAEFVFSESAGFPRVVAHYLIATLPVENVAFMQSMVESMLGTLESPRKRRQFPNSLEDLADVRCAQALLLLVDGLPKEDALAVFQRLIGLFGSTITLATRTYVEWIVMRIVMHYQRETTAALMRYDRERLLLRPPQSKFSLLTIHSQSVMDNHNAKTAAVCSTMICMQKVQGHLENDNILRLEWFTTLFSKMFPWLTSNNFSMRMYALVLLESAIAMCRADVYTCCGRAG